MPATEVVGKAQLANRGRHDCTMRLSSSDLENENENDTANRHCLAGSSGEAVVAYRFTFATGKSGHVHRLSQSGSRATA